MAKHWRTQLWPQQRVVWSLTCICKPWRGSLLDAVLLPGTCSWLQQGMHVCAAHQQALGVQLLQEYSFLYVLLTNHMFAGTGLQCNGLRCMAEAFWGPMSQEGFTETRRVSTSKDDQLVAAQLLPDFLLSACSALTSLECFCRDILVTGAVILSSLELKVSNTNFNRFDVSKHLYVICCLVCQTSCVAVCLLLVMAELQLVLVVFVAGLISMLGCWKATPSHIQPQASPSCSLFSCTAHCCFALLIDTLHCTPGTHLCNHCN